MTKKEVFKRMLKDPATQVWLFLVGITIFLVVGATALYMTMPDHHMNIRKIILN